MAMINIPSTNTDPNYRYRMPRLVSKIEGRGNGIKTNIMNMGDIARALKRPPEYPTRFCGTELGTQSKFDVAEGKSIVNGAHEPHDLQLLIDKFVEKFVLCPHCSLPEIDLVMKKGLVGCHCNACGHNGDLDNAHKVSSFIVRNPPKGSDSTMGKVKEGRSKAERREKKKSKAAIDEEVVNEEKEKKKKDKSSKKEKKKSSKKVDADAEEEDSEIAEGDQKKKDKKKSTKKAGLVDIQERERLTYDSPEVLEVKSRMLAFIAKEQKTSNGGTPESTTGSDSSRSVETKGDPELPSPMTPEKFFLELRIYQVSQEFDSTMRLFIALDVLMAPEWRTEESDRVALSSDLFMTHLPFIRRMADSSTDTFKICTAIEDFVLLRGKQPESLNNLQMILHKLFLEDVLDEEDLILRYSYESDLAENTKLSKNAKKRAALCDVQMSVRDAVQPFIGWLNEDASSSEDEEEEEA